MGTRSDLRLLVCVIVSHSAPVSFSVLGFLGFAHPRSRLHRPGRRDGLSTNMCFWNARIHAERPNGFSNLRKTTIEVFGTPVVRGNFLQIFAEVFHT